MEIQPQGETMKSSLEFLPQPIVVGALGGSGTRLVVQILSRIGIEVGWNSRDTLDSLAMRRFLGRWFEEVYGSCASEDSLPATAVQDFQEAVRMHRKTIDDPTAPWGWKNPRNMWLLSFYAGFSPSLRFVHVIRDGRDMALSTNTIALRHHGDTLLGAGWSQNLVRSQLELWRKGNIRAYSDSQRCLEPGNSLVLRYEDLCSNPLDTIQRLIAFVGMPACEALAAECAEFVRPSSGIGRWRSSDAAEIRVSEPAVKEALKVFGYIA